MNTILPISVLVLTKNEAKNLPGCLASLTWSDDIHVFDSNSDDETCAIARAAGATVTQRAFTNWSEHQNWALANLPFKHPWVFYIDADERVTWELQQFLTTIMASDCSGISAFSVRRIDYFMDRPLLHVQASPYYIRLFRPEKIKYERLVNPVTRVDGLIRKAEGTLDHFPFSKGIAEWLQKHNSYSTLEADQICQDRSQHNVRLSLRTALFGQDFHTRRYHQKELYYRLPFRPFLMFMLLYIFKRGFLDGKAGFHYAVLRAVYEYMIAVKLTERRLAHVVDLPEVTSEPTPAQPPRPSLLEDLNPKMRPIMN